MSLGRAALPVPRYGASVFSGAVAINIGCVSLLGEQGEGKSTLVLRPSGA